MFSSTSSGSTASDGFSDVHLEVEDGRPVGVRLDSGWRDRIPPELLGLAITTELVKVAPPVLQRPPRPPGGALEEQEQLVAMQRRLLSQLRSMLSTEDVATLGTRVASRNGQVTATLLTGRVVRIEIDAAWVRQVAVSAVPEVVEDCLARANAQLDADAATNDGLWAGPSGAG